MKFPIKKRSVQIVGIGIAAALVATLSGCGPSSDSGSDHGGSNKVRILMEEVPDTAIVQKMVDSFNKEHPDITIDIQSMNYGQMRDKLITSFLAPTPTYDLIVTDSPWMYDFAKGGYLKPLDSRLDSVASDYDYKDFTEPLRKIGEVDGKTYGIPFYNYALGIIYRKDLFKDANISVPTTLDEYVDDAKALTNKEHAGVAMQPQRGDKIFWEWANFLLAAGGSITDADNKVTLDSPEARTALKKYIEVYKNAAPANSLNWEFDQAQRAVASGKAAMMTSYNWMLPSLNDPDGPAGDLAGKFALAKFPGDKSVLASWDWSIPSNSSASDAAWTFINWITSPKQGKQRVIEGGAPVRSSTLKDHEVWEKGPGEAYFTTLQSILEKAEPLGVGPHAGQMVDDIGTELNSAVAGSKTVDEAITAAAKAAQNAINGND